MTMKASEHSIVLSGKDDEQQNGIWFCGAGGKPTLRFCDNGKVFVNGREVVEDMEIVTQLKEWLSMALADKATAHLASRAEMRIRELQVLIGAPRTVESLNEDIQTRKPPERTAKGHFTLRAIAARYLMQCATNRTVAEAQNDEQEAAVWAREAEEVSKALFSP